MSYAVRSVRELVEQGWTRRAIDGLPRPKDTHGIRVVTGPEAAYSVSARVQHALLGAPPDGVLSGWAAAAMHGVPDSFLDGTSDGVQRLPVDFSVDRVVGRHVRTGLRIRRSPVPDEDQLVSEGVRLTTARRTALDLARWARYESTALAMLDMCYRHGLIEPLSFSRYLAPLKRLHGLKLVRTTSPMMIDQAESPQESELRYVWSTSGLPRPVANPRVYDRIGNFVARIDLLDPETGFGAEYQGYWHLLDGAAEQDHARFAKFDRMNLTIVPIWKHDMATGDVVARLNRGYRKANARDQRFDSWTCQVRGS